MRADPLYDPSERPQSLLTKWLDGIKGAIAAVSDWLENPWAKIGVGLAMIIIGAVVTAVTSGGGAAAFMGAFLCGLTTALKAAVGGAITGAVIGGITAAIQGEDFFSGALKGLADGFYDGFLWGGITAGVSNILKPGSYCFIAGTLVLTKQGYQAIEELRPGDEVLSYDEETGECAYKKVLHLFRNKSADWVGVTINGKEIVSTLGHKYYLPQEKKWVSAKELKEADQVMLFDLTYGRVEKVREIHYEEEQTTYNFEVEDFHTYYVSESAVLVHNKLCEYTYENGDYQDAPYHTTKGNSKKSPRPIDGQAALDNSVQIVSSSTRRLGYSQGQLVVLNQTRPGLYHGHVRSYEQLTPEMKTIARKKWGIKK